MFNSSDPYKPENVPFVREAFAEASVEKLKRTIESAISGIPERNPGAHDPSDYSAQALVEKAEAAGIDPSDLKRALNRNALTLQISA